MWRDGEMVAGMVADFETIAVEFGDLFPGHVIRLVGAERDPFGDEEWGAKAEGFEQGTNDSVVGGYGVVEGEDH